MIFCLLQGLTAVLIAGKPSLLQWVLAWLFMLSGSALCGFVAAIWISNHGGYKKGLTIRPSGATEKPSTSQEHRILDRALGRKAGISAGLILAFAGGCFAGLQINRSREDAVWK